MADGTVTIDLKFPGNKSEFISDTDQVKKILTELGADTGKKAETEFKGNMDQLPNAAKKAKNQANSELNGIKKESQTKLKVDDSQGQSKISRFEKTVNRVPRSKKTRVEVEDRSSATLNRIKGKVNSLDGQTGRLRSHLRGVGQALREANLSPLDHLKAKIMGVNKEAGETHSIFRQMFSASLLSNIASGAWSRLTGWISAAKDEAKQYSLTQETMLATWHTLTGSAKEGQKMVDMTDKMAISAQNDVGMVNELNQKFYAIGHNADLTARLTKSVLTLQDAFGATDDAVENFGVQFAQMMANGKVSAQDMMSFVNVFPVLRTNLLKTEQAVTHNSKLTMAQMNDLMSKGKITAQTMEQVVQDTAKEYQGATANFGKTIPGMIRTVRSQMPVLLSAISDPLTKAANPIVAKVSDWVTSDQTKNAFTRLGNTFSNGLNKAIKAMSAGAGNGEGVTNALNKALEKANDLIRDFFNFLAAHGKSLGSMAVDMGKLSMEVGKQVWKDFAQILVTMGEAFGLVSAGASKSKDPLAKLADVIHNLAKNKTAIKLIAGYLVTMSTIKTFAPLASSIMGVATAIGKASNKIKAFRASLKKVDDVEELKGTEQAFDKLDKKAGTTADSVDSKVKSTGDKLVKDTQSTTDKMAKEAAKTGPGIGSKLAHGLEYGFMALNIVMPMFNAIRDRGSKRAADIGQSLGATTGAVMGGAIASAIGADPRLGAALGSALGSKLGKAAGTGYAKTFTASVAKGMRGFQGTMAKEVDKGLNTALDHTKSFGTRFRAALSAVNKGSYLNTLPGTGREKDGKDDDDSSSHKSKSRITRHTVKSLGGNHYSKADIESVKKMNAAIRSYTKSLERLKQVTKKNDPTSALKRMNKELGGTVSNWRKLAKPIKSVGNAFRTLQKFASAMSKRKTDPFQKFSKDLPKLDKALAKYSKRIKAHLKELSEALSGGGRSKKSKGIASAIKELDKPITGLTKDLKKLDRPLGRTAKDFKSLSKIFKEFSGKNNPLSRMAVGFKDLAKNLDKSYKTIGKDFEHLAKAIKASKIVTRLKQLKKPLTDITADIKTLDKHLTKVGKSLATVNKSLTRTQKLAGARSGFNKLSIAVKRLYGTIRRYPFGGELQHQAKLANRAMIQISRRWMEFWRDINRNSERGQERLKSSWSSTTKKLLSIEGSFTKAFLSRWSKYISQVDTKFKKGMSLLPGYATSAMRGVVRNLNRGIRAVNGTISAFGGRSGAIRYARYANGTGYNPITAPTLAVLNDGNDSPETGNKEAIYDRNTGAFGIVQGTNTPALLVPGQEVITASDTRNLMNFMGIRHFAGGTGWLSSLMSWGKGSDNSLRKFFDLANKIIGHPANYLNGIFSLGAISPSRGAMNTLGRLAFNKGKQQANSFWSTMWSMVNDSLNAGGAEGGLLGAVEKYGQGHPYVWGAAGPSAFDCSGLVMYALRKAFGISFPHFSGAQFSRTVAVSNPQPGDLVFFGPGGSQHVGVYAGRGRYYSAMSPASGIGMSAVGAGAQYRRIPGLRNEAASSTGPKATKGLESFVKRTVGPGFWKFIGKLSDLFGVDAENNPAGAGVQRWGELVKKALAKNGLPTTSAYVNAWLRQIQTESNGNPKAVGGNDGLSEGNATGLLQTKPGTFRNNAFAGHNDIFNGYDNMLAAIRYAKRRYGASGMLAVIGHGHGYAEGGLATQPSIFGEAGPEMAIPLSSNRSSRTYELIGKTAAIAAARDNLTGHVQDNTELVKQMKNLVQQDQLLQQIIAGENEVRVNINMDGRKVGQMSAKYVSRVMAHKMNGRRLKFSG